MSVINNALTELANKDSEKASYITKADIPVVKQGSKLAWALGGFALSLCLGGWAVSHQATTIVTTIEEASTIPTIDLNNDLADNQEEDKFLTVKNSTVAVTAKAENKETISVVENTQPIIENTPISTPVDTKTTTMKIAQVAVPAKSSETVASATSEPNKIKVENTQVSTGTMTVEHVELTPHQLADNAIERGKKELDSNDLDGAIEEFETALKYVPSDELTRKRLAALYYGKSDLRKSIEVLQHGIKLDEDSQKLRLALAKILVKENQPEAALSPLVYMPENVETDYLAMRAALAQQIKSSSVAFESYQMLVEREPNSARWWLGLAIQQERKQLYSEAKSSYQEANERVGVSKQTQAFIRDRITLLESLEGGSSAN